jgi:TPR repeat protein
MAFVGLLSVNQEWVFVMKKILRVIACVCCCVFLLAELSAGAGADGLNKLKNLSYDGTPESLQKIQDAAKPFALSQNLVALNIYRQTMYGLGQVVKREKTPSTSTIVMNKERSKAIVPWVKLVKEKAAGGDSFYKTVLGIMYNFGQGVAEDKPISLKLWEEASADYHDANYKLGTTYSQGPKAKIDTAKVLAYFRKGADLGGAISLYNLGCFYNEGKYVAKDEKKAFEYWLAAAEKGHSTAQRNVGLCFIKGLGAEVNYAKAKKWFEKAMASGDRGAPLLLKEHFGTSRAAQLPDRGRPVHGH